MVIAHHHARVIGYPATHRGPAIFQRPAILPALPIGEHVPGRVTLPDPDRQREPGGSAESSRCAGQLERGGRRSGAALQQHGVLNRAVLQSTPP